MKFAVDFSRLILYSSWDCYKKAENFGYLIWNYDNKKPNLYKIDPIKLNYFWAYNRLCGN